MRAQIADTHTNTHTNTHTELFNRMELVKTTSDILRVVNSIPRTDLTIRPVFNKNPFQPIFDIFLLFFKPFCSVIYVPVIQHQYRCISIFIIRDVDDVAQKRKQGPSWTDRNAALFVCARSHSTVTGMKKEFRCQGIEINQIAPS